ncbi:MAG: 50S ribosomal protein L11 methyltransferase [Chloroflexi bacterium]|nr:50S ribosomal protein L11 methyltransferase [Chloroflexota bacterium]
MDYLELAVAVRPQSVEAVADILRRHVPAGVSIEAPYTAADEEGGVALADDAPVRLRAWLPADGAGSRAVVVALRGELRDLGDALVRPLRARTVRDAVWADAWKRHFRPLRVGRRLVLRPSWRRYRARKNDIVIELDPGQAFGTGQHPTTRLCLEALEERLQAGATVLDVGAGSGILSLAAALLGAAHVDALDIDPAAVHATEENAARNGVQGLVRVGRGSLGEAWPFPEPPAGRYDLVLANLSSRIVQELARPLLAALRPDGVALVSGLIEEQEAACRGALTNAGGHVVDSRSEGDWRLLVVGATARRHRTSKAPDPPQRRGR